MKNVIVFNRGPGLIIHLALVIAVLSTCTVNAQSLKRECIASVGSSAVAGSILIQQTIGQPYHTGTFYSSELSMRPGFHQPFNLFSGDAPSASDRVITLYPNPAASVFSIDSPTAQINYMKVTDMSGQLILASQILGSPNNLSCQNWQNGLYVITVFDKNGKQYSSKLIVSK